MKRQRLAVLLHDLSPGGTERIALRLAGAWAVCGRDVTIFCGDPTGALRSQLPANIKVVSPLTPIARGWRSRERLGVWAAKSCGAHNIDGLFIPGNFHFPALPRLEAGRSSGMVVVCKLSNPVGRSDRGVHAQALAERSMERRLRHADAVVAMSASLAEDVRSALGVLPLSVIEEPILGENDHAAFQYTGARHGIAAAGRFVPQKDFGLAVRTLAQVSDPRTELTIAGDGPLLPQIREMAASTELYGRIHLPGRLDDVKPLFGQSRLLLLSSHYEGFPAVAVEALATGARIVSTDCSPAMAEIVSSPEFGEVVCSRSPVALAEAIDRQMEKGPIPQPSINWLYETFGLVRSGQRYLDLFDSL